MEIPMLDESEFEIASKLYRRAFSKSGQSMKERFQPLLEYYESVTGFSESVPNAIMHHRISEHGPPCEKCGKPYRTPKATFCAYCGNQREKVVL